MGKAKKNPVAPERYNGKSKGIELATSKLINSRSHLFYQGIPCQMDLDSLQTENHSKGSETVNPPKQKRTPNGIHDTSRNPQFPHSVEYREEILRWQQKSVVRRSADEAGQYVSATSLFRVATEIAKCIGGCLADVPPHKRSVRLLRQLLIDYKAVQSLRDGRTLISLYKVHQILQDNFSNSYLCKFCNIMLSESLKNTVSNSIDV